MTAPMTDDALIALAEHRFALADHDGATHEDCRQLRDIFPAVLQRLREKGKRPPSGVLRHFGSALMDFR